MDSLKGEAPPKDIHKEIHIILSVTSIKTIKSLCWTVNITHFYRIREEGESGEPSPTVDEN